MPRSSEKTLQAIRASAFHLFFKRGYTRVSMDDIAEEAGVTKRTLYYHFDSKDALLDDALGRGAEQSDAATQNWKDSSAKSSHEFLDGLILGLVTWAKTKGWTGSGFSRLSLELADLPGHPVRKAAKLHKASVQTWIEKELSERGDKNASSNAETFCILTEGALILSLIHDDIGYIERLRDKVSAIFLVQNSAGHSSTIEA